MSIIDDLLRSGAEGARVSATLVSNQENGRACYAHGSLVFTPALARLRSSIPAQLKTGPGGGFETPGPFDCYFSDRIYFDPGPRIPGTVGVARPPQRFDSDASEYLEVSLSGFDGTALAPSIRLTLAGRKPVVISAQAHGDLFAGFGRSFADGSPAGYVLAISGQKQ